VQIFIGQESGYQILDDCSLVTAPYTLDNETVGVLGRDRAHPHGLRAGHPDRGRDRPAAGLRLEFPTLDPISAAEAPPPPMGQRRVDAVTQALDMTHPNDTDAIIPEPEAGSTAPGTVEAELAEARAKADENWNSYLRAVAEADNVRKRAQRDVEAASRYAIERFAAELLDVRDSLELGVPPARADSARLLEGNGGDPAVAHRAFEKSGLSVVDPVGQPFNPNSTRPWPPSPRRSSRPARSWPRSRRATCSTAVLRPAGCWLPASRTRLPADPDLNPPLPAPN